MHQVGAFSRNRAQSRGYDYQCRAARSAYDRKYLSSEKGKKAREKYYKEHHRELRERNLTSYRKRRESILAQKRKYYREKHETIREYKARYYRDNHETILEQKKKYYHENRDELRERRRTNRCKALAIIGEVCAWSQLGGCGGSIEIDHIIPVKHHRRYGYASHGNSLERWVVHHPEEAKKRLQPLCNCHNCFKSNMPDDVARAKWIAKHQKKAA
jgi:hypothetical protein